MYIRQTTTKSKKTGENYFSHRLVESNRINGKVKQRTLLNLGRRFSIEKSQWKTLVSCIESLLNPQQSLFESDLDPVLESEAQRIVSKLHEKGYGQPAVAAQYESIDIDSFEAYQPRTVGVEQLALHAFEQLEFPKILKSCGLNTPQIAAALGSIVGRMAGVGSELATHQWLQKESGLGELIGFDYEKMGHDRLYQASDLLWKHKTRIETHLFDRERDLFSLTETVALYDLTNTFFEGQLVDAEQAQRGRSKEKRTDCPLITLALVLDSSGFPRRSEHFAGNISEPGTLNEMLTGLGVKAGATIILDAGIATEDNIEWLVEKDYCYIVVSRKRQREFDENQAVVVKKDQQGEPLVKAQKKSNEEGTEVFLYCHSKDREYKEVAIFEKPAKAFEEKLDSLNQGLSKKRTIKKIDLIQQRIGRLKEKYKRVSAHYQIEIKEKEGKATSICWQQIKTPASMATHPGVYCLRTNQIDWSEEKLWKTYTMLTRIESVFKSLKSEMGLRPIFHHKQKRIDGHLFITLLAYHLVHTLRTQLKNKGINDSWNSLRQLVKTRQRVSFMVQCEDGRALHLRQITRIEAHQSPIYSALNCPTKIKSSKMLV